MPTDILSLTTRDFLAATAAKTPTPGGGSVAALVGALAAALGQMSIHYSLGKKSLEPHRPALEAALTRLQKSSELMQELVSEDMAAYEALAELLKLPKDQRLAHPNYPPAVLAAIRVPETIAALALAILETCQSLFDKTNPYLLSDLVMAAALANATVRGAELNVWANLPLLPDPADAPAFRRRAQALTEKADRDWAQLRAALEKKLSSP